MNTPRPALRSVAFLAASLVMCAAFSSAHAETPKAKKPAAKAASKSGAAAPARQAAPSGPAPASAEQIEAAQSVYYGTYQCEFNQTLKISESIKHPSYVELQHSRTDYLMKPVLSSTGAIRLEDVSGQTLMIQIASKSMLLNVRTAQRIVDDCVSPSQRDVADATKAGRTQGGESMLAPNPAATPTR